MKKHPSLLSFGAILSSSHVAEQVPHFFIYTNVFVDGAVRKKKSCVNCYVLFAAVVGGNSQWLA